MTGVRRRWAAPLVAFALALAGCSGGGGTDEARDDPVGATRDPSADRVVQFVGGGQTRIGGAVNAPASATGPAPGVLIVPGMAPTDRDGQVAGTVPDLLYKDLSASLTDAGMVTLRYDRRGAGSSRLGPDQRLSWDDMVTDARTALSFLGRRTEVGESPLAVVGHDVGGLIALQLAAAEPRVKAVALVSTPGRPLVDVLADGFAASNGQESADAFRSTVATLLATGSLPERSTIRAEHQDVLPAGADAMLRSLFTLDPLADAGSVDVPVLVAVGGASTTVTASDAERLAQALGGRAETVTAPGAGPTLLQVGAAGSRGPVDPNDHTFHGAPPPQPKSTREPATVERITGFLRTHLTGVGR
jgi:dienelactone hydrolase